MFSYPWPLSLTIGFSGRRLALFVAREVGLERRVHLANVVIYVEYPLAAKVSDKHSVYDDDTPSEKEEGPKPSQKMHKIRYSDIYMIIPVNLWNSQMTRDRRCGHKMFARVCEF